MAKINTINGKKVDIDERVFDDWRFMKALNKADSDNGSEMIAGTVELVSLIFGKAEDTVMEAIAKKHNGYIPQEAVKDEILNAIDQIKALKNSQSSPG